MRNIILLAIAGLIWLGIWFDINYRVLGPDSMLYWVGYRVVRSKCEGYVSKVKEVSIYWKGKEFVIFRKGDKWIKQEGEKEVELIPYPVEDFLSGLFSARFSRSFKEMDEYGIGKDKIVVRFVDGRNLVILLGEDVPGGLGRYAKVGDRAGILDQRYLYMLDRVISWEKEGRNDRGRVKRGLGVREGRADKTNSGPDRRGRD